MSKGLFYLIMALAGIVALFFMGNRLVAEHKVATLDDFMASSTPAASSSPTAFGQLLQSISSSTGSLQIKERESASTTVPSLDSLKTTTVYASKGSVKAFIADTESAREQGLSGQPSLPNGIGVLFVFDAPGKYGFWMKDMRFPIDIVWIGKDKKIVGVTKNVLPSSYPFVFMPPKDILYALEVNAGSVSSFGLITGTSIRFSF